MTDSVRQRASENRKFRKSANPVPLKAVDVPLTEERLAILGHEMRNPLNALSCALQAWPSSLDDTQLMKQLLQVMVRQVTQLTRLSDDLLDTGRIAQGQFSIRRVTVDIGSVIRTAIEEVQPLVNRYRHTLTVSLPDTAITLFGDESRLIQVIANLLQNSAKFTDRNGNLHITLEQDNDEVVVRVSDDGRGISAQGLPKIFLPNTGSKRNSAANGDGLGIGLRLAKTIVELHGGTIEAFSDGLGLGSTFMVKLPMLTDIAARTTLDASHAPAPDLDGCQHLPHYQILVVDDERSMRFLMSRLLQKIGQSVTVADNGDAAIQMILQDRPHVVFVDLQMHGISGFDVARQLRSYPELDRMVLIALSGHADEASRKLAAESGFDRYLVKPTSIAMLTETLFGIAEMSTARVSLLSANA